MLDINEIGHKELEGYRQIHGQLFRSFYCLKAWLGDDNLAVVSALENLVAEAVNTTLIAPDIQITLTMGNCENFISHYIRKVNPKGQLAVCGIIIVPP